MKITNFILFLLKLTRTHFLCWCLCLACAPGSLVAAGNDGIRQAQQAAGIPTTGGLNQGTAKEEVPEISGITEDAPLGDSENASSVSDQLKDLTSEERQALENLNISENLQETANEFMNGIRPELTENDRKALRLLGYSDDEIDQLSGASLTDKAEQEKFKNRLNRYADKKNGEIESGVMNDLVPGLASSVIGLAFASMLGIVVGVRCYNMPSALAFAGTSGAWVGLEMMIWKGYQIRMDDIETLQNATKIPRQIEKKIGRAKEIIKDLEDSFKASGMEDFEAFLAQNKSKINELKDMARALRDFLKKAKDQQFGALRSIQESIELAAETSKKKSRNAKVAAIGYTAAASVAAAEAFNLFSAGGSCVGVTSGYHSFKGKPLWTLMMMALVEKSYAGFASVGDLDKIGIPIGGGLAAAYLGFEKKFADKIYSSATGRGIVFLAMAGIGYLAYTKLEKASKFLAKQANELDIFATAVEEKLESFKMSFSDSAQLVRDLKDDILPELEEIANSLGEKGDKIKDILKEEGDKLAQEKLDELGLDENEVKDLVQEELKYDQNEIAKDLKGSVKEKLSDFDTSDIPDVSPLTGSNDGPWWQNLGLSFIKEAHAVPNMSIAPSCFVRTKGFVAADPTCQCRKGSKCFSSRFPKRLRMEKNNEFAAFSYKLGSLVGQSSDAIMSGHARRGLKGFQKAGSLYQKMDINTRKLLSRKVGSKVDYKVTGRLVAAAYGDLRPALRTYFKKQGSKSQKGASFSPAVSSQKVKKGRNRLVSPKVRAQALRASLRQKIELAKSLGNPSVSSFKAIQSSGTSAKGNVREVYDYSREAITRDSTKNIFQVIKKRYLIIQSQGRL